MRRRQHAAGSRDDVPAAVPAVHAAARRSDGVRRDGVAGQGAAREPDGEPGRRVQPDDRRRPQPEQPAPPAGDAGDGGSVESRRSRWRSTRRASPTRATSRSSSSAASRPRRSSRWSKPTSPACRRPTPTRRGATSASRRRAAIVDKTVEKGIAPKSEVAIVFSGPFEYDDAHTLALRTMTLVLQSRLLDTHPPGARRNLQHHRHSETRRSFRGPSISVRIDWTCDPARTADAGAARLRGDRVRQGRRSLAPDQVALIREALLREFERNSQDNGYLLNQIARRYEDGDAADIGAVADMPERIAALTGAAIQRGGADLPEHQQLREGDADARGEVTQPARVAAVSRRARPCNSCASDSDAT